jgi:ATP-dependent HslUV protease subunit HslV
MTNVFLFTALMDVPGLTAESIAQKAMNIAADICIYTNRNFLMETLDTNL